MARRDDWERRLDDVFVAALTKPFVWGEHDCAMFVADCVYAMTDVDCALPHFRGRYYTEIGAARRTREYCGGHIEKMAEKIARDEGWPDIPVSTAGRGDVLLVNYELGQSLAIVSLNGKHALAPSRDGGLISVPRLNAVRAWRIK
jgi:hypothetical protein